MFGKSELFCRLIQAVTGDKIDLDGDPHTQATLREDDVLLNIIKFDTFAPTQNKRFYSADMQRTYKESRQERRTVYYACRAVSTQNVDDMAYEDLNPVHISFILTSHENGKAIQHVKLCDIDTHEVFDELITLTQVYIPTVLKTYDKSSDLYIFARFFKITSHKKADAFVKKFSAHDLGKELILMYNTAIANAQELQQLESRPYFLGRLTEAQLEEERQKARKKGEETGRKKGREEGREEGRKEGEKIGVKKGIAIGEERGKIISVVNLIKFLGFKLSNAMDAIQIDLKYRQDIIDELNNQGISFKE